MPFRPPATPSSSPDTLPDEAGFRRSLRLAGLRLAVLVGLPALALVGLELLLARAAPAEERQFRAVLFFALGLFTLLVVPFAILGLNRLLRRIVETYRISSKIAERRANELGTTLRSIGDAVIATNAAGEVVFLNPVAERLMGWSSAEAHGRPLAEVFLIFNEETGAPADNPVERVLRERVVVGLANHTVLRARTGGETPIEDSAAPILDDAGEVQGVILVFHDVGEKRAGQRLLRESEQRFRFLNTLGEATRALSDPREIMATTARLLGIHLSVSRCAYADVEPDRERFTIEHDYTDGCGSTVGAYQLSLFGPRAVAELQDGRTLVVRDVDAELAEAGGAEMFNAIGIKAVVCCPLVKAGGLRAMMAIHQKAPRDWTLAEIALLEEVAERCWATIERARVEGRMREGARLSALRADVAAQLAFGETLDCTLQSCCELLVRHIDAAFARVWTLSEAEPVLELRASAGLYTHLDGPHARVPVGAFKIGRIAQSRQPHLTNDVAHDPNISDAEWARREGMVAFAGYPLIVEGRVLGVLGLFARHALSPAVLADLAPIADGVAQCIERKRAEIALRASETLKTAIIDTSLDGFILMDHLGRIADWNAAAERIFDLPRTEAVGQPLGDVIVPERLREAHHRGVERYVASREARILGKRYELPALRADGSEFPCEISISHIPGSEPPLFAGFVRDISDRRAAEIAVREGEERFRAMADHIPQLAWMTDETGWRFWYNRRWFDYTGTTLEEMQGWGWQKVHHPDHVARVTEKFTQHIARGEVWEDTFPLRAADGEYRWFLSRARPIRDEQGRVLRWFGTNTDVTEQRDLAEQLGRAKEQAEASSRAVAETAERFRLLSEVVALQVWTAAPDGALDYANHECVEYHGGDLERDILGSAWAQFVHPDDLSAASRAWQSSLASGQRYEVEFRLRGVRNGYRWFLVRAEAMRDGAGGIVKWFGTNTDIHDLKTAQRDAEQASRAKDDFLAALSHELRTPLTPVLMTAAALREDERLPADAREQLSMMERNIALEARLIDDLLDLTRIANGKLPLRPQPCDAHSLINLAFEIVRDDAQAKGITLEREFTALRSGLVADPARFQQVIWNLLRNAVKFTPSGGRIVVRTHDEAGGAAPRLHIEVNDSGIGIDAAALEHIFLPFEQAGLTGDHRFGGMGLGLAIARAIVDVHGGTIRAESEGLDRGSTFIVELPGATEPPQGMSEGDARAAEMHPGDGKADQPERSLRLLLVEDHEATLQVLSRLLTRAGHQIVTANTIAAALAAAAAATFDVVISDLGLPDGTGTELMSKLRDLYGLRGIALSGYGMEEDVVRSREAGFATHLTKPVDFTHLKRALQSVVAGEAAV